jgi:hypothetical protein
MSWFDDKFMFWLFCLAATLVTALAVYGVSWVVVTLVAAIAAAGAPAWAALGGFLFAFSFVVMRL